MKKDFEKRVADKKLAMLSKFAEAAGKPASQYKGHGGVEYEISKADTEVRLEQERLAAEAKTKQMAEGRAMIDERKAAEAAARPNNHVIRRGR